VPASGLSIPSLMNASEILSLPKMLSVANAFKISDHQCNLARAN
jgi:hypothetical protein